MRTSIGIGSAYYTGNDWPELVEFTLEAERLGVDQAWSAEAWGMDAVVPLAFLAARTTRMKLLGYCGKGEGPAFVREHTFTVDGSFPVNTSGGQLSVGQAGAAGGYLGLVEALRQLTDAAENRQVRDAQLALVSGFGMINYDRGLSTGAAILAAA